MDAVDGDLAEGDFIEDPIKENEIDIAEDENAEPIEDGVQDISNEDYTGDPSEEETEGDVTGEEPSMDSLPEDLYEDTGMEDEAGMDDLGDMEDLSGEDIGDLDPDAGDIDDVREEDQAGEDADVEDLVGEDVCVEDVIVEEDGSGEDVVGEDMPGEDPREEDIVEEEIVVISCAGLPDFTPCVVVTDPDRDYDICISSECRSPGCGDVTCNPPGPHFPLPDTNQRACYNTVGDVIPCPGTAGDPSCATTDWCGQDAQYGWDTDHEESGRFTRTGADEPLVTDNVTGLVWQGCPAGRRGSDCSGGSTSLINWDAAVAYCDALTWGGYDDWHLQDRYELQSIVDYGRSSPSIDTSAFPQTPSAVFWSSSSYAAGSPSFAWCVDFSHGGQVGYSGKGSGIAVRCVRRGGIGEERFTIEAGSEPVVTDNVTGLEWQGCPAGLSGSDCSTGSYISRTWQGALSFCEGLGWGGHDDWYLPDNKELASIVDDHAIDPSIDTSAFLGTPSTYFWSSSSYAGSPSIAWRVTFSYGYVNYNDKGLVHAVRCVRRGP